MKNKISKLNIEDILSLSTMQKGILFHYINEINGSAYIEQISINLDGKLNINSFRKAWQWVVNNNEMLRSVFRFKKIDNPVQIILKKKEIPIKFIDISKEKSDSDRDRLLEKIKVEDRQKQFNLETDPLLHITLCKITEENYEMIINSHHIIYDGWSNGIILKDFFKAYREFKLGKIPTNNNKIKFKFFLKWFNKIDKNSHQNYWTRYLENFKSKTSLPILNDDAIDDVAQNEFTVKLSEDIYKDLMQLSNDCNITFSTFFYTLWGLLLQKYSNMDDIIFGTTVSGRPKEIVGIENVVGLFINTIPLRVQSKNDNKISELLIEVQQDIQERRTFENTSLVDIKSYSEMANKESLFDTIVVYENYPLDEVINPDLDIKINSYQTHERTNYDINLIIDNFQGLKLNFVYNTRLFDNKSMKRLANHFQTIIKSVIIDPTQSVNQLDMLSDEEKNNIIHNFNDTYFQYSEKKLIYQLLEEQVEKTPDNTAIVFKDQKVTYQELNDRSNQLARLLRRRGVQPGEIVGVMVKRSIEMSIALWAVLKVGGVYLPISPDYPEKRIEYLFNDSDLNLVLTQSDFLNMIIDDYDVINLDDDIYCGDKSNLEPVINSRDLAYIIYTSGSTGTPKGVMIEHKSVINLLTWMQKQYQLGEDDVILQMTAFTFDVSVWELFWWPLVGAKLCFLPPNGEKDPEMIVNTIEKQNVTIMHFVPSMLNAFLNYLENFSVLDRLEDLRYVFASGETLKPHQLQQFNRLLNHNNGTRIFDLYGPTEATVYASYFNCPTDHKLHKTIPIGEPIGNAQIYILDKYNQIVPTGVPGELCISGDGLARGYLNQPELTDKKFVSNPIDIGKRMYRTGDLAKWRSDGKIEFLGRIDFQVKIRGHRIELSEIDFYLSNHEAVSESVVVAREDSKGDKYICAYYVLSKRIASSELGQYLGDILPKYMVPAHLIQLDEFTLNTNGKIDRGALPEPDTNINQNSYVEPSSILEEKLIIIWSEILDREVIGIKDNFFELGGHSLKATTLITKVYKEMDVEITIGDVFDNPTVEEMANCIENSDKTIYSNVEKVEAKDYYPLSSAQRRLFLLDKLEGINTAYNMSGAVQIIGKIDIDSLESAFKKLIKRHESLRTSFTIIDGEPVQKVTQEINFEIERIDGSVIENNSEVDSIIKSFIRKFDLNQVPLFRVGLITNLSTTYLESGDQQKLSNILILDTHHIISDGTSMGILMKEIGSLYNQEELSELRIQYKDFAVWHNKFLESDAIKRQEEFWIDTFSGEVPVLDMPTDKPRPSILTYTGDKVEFEIDSNLTEMLNNFAQDQGVTVYMLLLAVYNILLSKYSGQEDIIVGSPIVGRPHSDFENVIGMFVNTLPIRNFPKKDKTFIEFLSNLKYNTLKAYENQDYQFEMLVEKLDLERDRGRNPFFDVMFTLQNREDWRQSIDGIEFVEYNINSKISKFDLTLTAEYLENILFTIDYRTDLYKEISIKRMAGHYKNLLRIIIEKPNIKLADICLTSKEEREKILYEFNDTNTTWDISVQTIHQLFERRVAKKSENISLVYKDEKMTYRELNSKSNKLATLLRKKGVGPDVIVGIIADRSFEMIIGIMSILKAGGAYLPIDPDYPTSRVEYMLNDSQARLILVQSHLISQIEKSDYFDEIINLDNQDNYIGDGDNLELLNSSADLAYIIYTSGSTGKPKGVMVEHRNLLNIINYLYNEYSFAEEDSYLLKTAYTFDVSVSEIFGWFLGNGRLIIPEKDIEKDSRALIEIIEKYNITHINFVPSMLTIFFNTLNKTDFEVLNQLKYIFIAGESLSKSLVNKLSNELDDVILENLYGPTEATIYATKYSLQDLKKASSVPIGKPLANVQAYILDDQGNLQPVGIPGELYLAGAGITRGYINRTELTEDRYIPDTFRLVGKMYKTGDLARWLPDGNIEFLGRIDNQVKVRGYRIELGEIENQLLRNDRINEAVVVDKEDKIGDKYLCGYIVTNKDISIYQIKSNLANTLPEYMVPSHLVKLGELPKTTSGKIDRKSLPEPSINRDLERKYVAATNELEASLVETWSKILGVDKISINDNFFDLGGHSLKAMTFISKASKELGLKISFDQIFDNPTIKELSQTVDLIGEDFYSEISSVAKRAYYHLSSAQKRLFLLDELENDNTKYNIPGAMTIKGDVDKERLEASFKKVIDRHESLRTSFDFLEGEPVQYIHQNVDFRIEYLTLDSLNLEDIIEPFDLRETPLLRVKLIKTSDEHLLLFDMHHIISDGISLEILINEVTDVYEDKELEELKIQYKDFAAWQNKLLNSDKINTQEEYWLEVFSGEIPILNLPTDYTRPAVMNYEGAQLKLEIEEELTSRLEELAREEEVTMYMILLAAYNILLSKYSGQEDIIIGSPIAGRPHADLENIIGMFVNTLAMRNFPQSDMCVLEFLNEVRENSLKAYQNQDYQFEMLVEKLDIERDLSRSALFDVMFVLQNQIEEDVIMMDNLEFTPYEFENNISKFDLTLYAIEKSGKVELNYTYSTQLFKEETVEKLARHYIKILQEIVEDPMRRLVDIDMFFEEEKKELLIDFNDTMVEIPEDKTIQALFENQVKRTPDKIALTFAGQDITYQELNQRANRLAITLNSRDIEKDQIVGLLMDRSINMVIGMLGILKAGGAYLPIDSGYPIDRISYMLNDSGAELLLTTSTYNQTLSTDLPEDIKVLTIDQLGDPNNLDKLETIKSNTDDLSYIIYTSGSTGKPKGVCIEQKSLVNYVNWFSKQAKISEDDSGVLLTSFAFDLGYTALWTSLVLGNRLYIVPEDIYKDPNHLIDYLSDNSITYIKATPSLFNMIVNSPGFNSNKSLEDLRLIVLGGEQIRPNDLINYRKKYPNVEFMNHYGPTEATIGCISTMIDDNNFAQFVEQPVIGRPNSNMAAYVLDKDNNLVPIGVEGELCISGIGLARGYINRPELTKNKFIENPFGSHNDLNSSWKNLYKTGDLVKWLPDGRIEFIGRIDNQVKIRGFRVEIGEIKNQLLTHNDIDEVAVIAGQDQDDSKYLTAYYVSKKELTGTELRQYLLKMLPDYMVPSYFVELDKLPLTANGKLDSKELPDPVSSINTEEDYVKPTNSLEKGLVSIWQEVLEVNKIGIYDNFFELGGHSLKATNFITKVYKELDVKITLRQVFLTPTIKKLADFIMKSQKSSYQRIPIAKNGLKKGERIYPVSSAQKRLFILDQMDNIDISYNVPYAMYIEGEVDYDRLEKSFEKLIERHELLRTSFKMVDDQPVQQIYDNVDFNINYITLGLEGHHMDNDSKIDDKIRKIINQIIQPFDLKQPPLLKVHLIRLNRNYHILILDRHHIITDEKSTEIFIKEVVSLYEGVELPELRIQYKDFAVWQNKLFESESIKEQEKYWLNIFEGDIPTLEMPTDYSRPSVKSFKGDRIQFTLSEELTDRFKSMTLENDVTLYMLLLTVYNILLSKYSGQEDIVVGSPIANRNHGDLENIIGMFANTLPLRNSPEKDKTCIEFLTEVRQNALEAYENQDYQFEMLVERLNIDRDRSRNPLFDTVLVLQTIDKEVNIEELNFTPYPLDFNIAKFDLRLAAVENSEGLWFEIEYDTELYSKETVLRMLNHMENIISKVVENPDIRLADIDMLSSEEKQNLIFDFNACSTEYSHDKPVHQLFEEQAKRTPDGTALVFGDKEMTYSRLNVRSNQLARTLRKKGVKPNMLVSLVVEPTFEMVIGLLAILKAGGAYLPIDPEYPEERIGFMLKDSNSELLLTQSQLIKEINFDGEVVNLDDDKIYTGQESNLEIVNRPNDIIYTIYTSGSTGNPKGVLIEHRGVVNYIVWASKVYLQEAKGDFPLYSSLSFDLTVTSIYVPLLTGNKIVIYGQDDKELLISKIIREDKVDIIKLTPAHLRVIRGLDIDHSRVKRFIVGGEELKRKLAADISEKFDHQIEIYNEYGPTEAVVGCMIYKYDFDQDKGLTVPIGVPADNVQIYLLDSALNPVPVGVPGEIYISGDGVARGYLNREEITKDSFIPNPFETGKRMYKTGDLGKMLPCSNIQFLGRIDHQVKVRGYRIELGEVEAQLQKIAKIKESVVIDKPDTTGERYLCGYLVAEEGTDEVAVREALSQQLPEYMIPTQLVFLDNMPLTTNGKIDRNALPDPLKVVEKDQISEQPRNKAEESILNIWSEVLGKEDIGIHDNFFSLGGHSLTATQLVARLSKELSVNMTLLEIFERPTIAQLAELVDESEEVIYSTIEPVEEKEYYPVSSAQKRLFILKQFEDAGTSYNMPGIYIIDGDLDCQRLTRAFKELVDRHEALRTSFKSIDGELVQVIHDDIDFEIDLLSLDGRELEDHEIKTILREYIKPFDLNKAPLVRVGLLESRDKTCMIFDMHHIISDGVSMNIIVNDVMKLYNNNSLPELKLQYKDFTVWQNDLFSSDQIREQEEYWLDTFEGEIPELNLPTDYPRPTVNTFKGDRLHFALEEGLTARLEKIAQKNDATLYMALLSIYNILLSKYSRQEDIIVGSPIAGRPHADLENIVGMFVNTLAMRNFPESNKRFSQFLAEVRDRALTAYDNQDYQFEVLVEKLDLDRAMNRNPLFDVMFTLQTFDEINLDLEGIRLEEYNFENKISKFDLTLNGYIEDGQIQFTLEYRTDLFKEETLERFSHHFINTVKDIVENPDKLLADITIIDETEREELLVRFNDTDMDYPKDKTISELFEEQVSQNPDKLAVILGQEKLTYSQLNQRANQLARHLRIKGIGPDSFVGMMVERSPEMIIGILGILKAGGGYVPIDPDYPQSRIEYMIEDSQIELLLTHQKMAEKIDFNGEIIDIDNEQLYTGESSNLKTMHKSDNIAYLIYTSGTTGKPKGILTMQYNVTRVVKDTNYIDINRDDKVIQLSNYAFDGSVFDIYGALLNGAALVLIEKERLLDMIKLAEVIEKREISVLFITTALFNTLVDLNITCFANVRKVLFGGERISVEHARKALEYMGQDKIIHVYGPTESTVYATYYFINQIEEGARNIPIGSPLANTQVYIMDKNNNPQPVGVEGELCISGDGLARGYLNRPDLTADKFVTNPFKPGERLYRTGDLARWLPDGNIEFIGRVDDQIKLRGFRIELGEVESHLLKIEEVQAAVVMVRKDESGDKYLCGYVTLEKDLEEGSIKSELQVELPKYMVPDQLVVIEEMPLTPNGKIDKKALPVPEGVGQKGKELTPPRNKTEVLMLNIWREVLGREEIGIHEDFFEMGGHSLKATRLAARLSKELGVNINLKEIFARPTIAQLAELVDESEEVIYSTIEPVEEREYYPVSSAQKRLFILNKFENAGIGYNMPVAYQIKGDLNYDKIAEAFEELIERHEILRTSFKYSNGQLIQRIHQNIDFKIDIIERAEKDLARDDIKQIVEEFIQPFDLSKAPLLRVGLIKYGVDTIMMWDMHHIISDGVSMNIMIDEVMKLYQGKSLTELKLHYKDFSVWQNKLFKSEQIKGQENYWVDTLGGEIPELNLPTDNPRPSINNYEGDIFHFELDKRLTKQLEQIAQTNGATLYMVLLTVYNILLSKYSGQDDIIVGSPIAGRPHTDLENMIGMFVNTLAMRNYPKNDKSFIEFLTEVRNRALEAYDNQDYQFEMLVEKLNLERVINRNPIFDVMFTLHTFDKNSIELEGLKLDKFTYDGQISKFDLNLNGVKEDGKIHFALEYSTALFKRSTIKALSNHFVNIVEKVAQNPEKLLINIDILSQDEKDRLLFELNDTKRKYQKDKTITELFEEQVTRTPDNIALVFEDKQISYRDLNQKSNQLARKLRSNGVDSDQIVGIMTNRSLEMMIGILGILKAGGAYLPIDPEYPQDRINYMISDSGTDMLVTDSSLNGKVETVKNILNLDDESIYRGENSNLDVINDANNLAYIIYTSGSTGKPKGVMIEYRSVNNFILGITDIIEFRSTKTIMSLTTISFDIFVLETILPLVKGCRVVIANEEEQMIQELFNQALLRNKVDMLQATPSRMKLMLNDEDRVDGVQNLSEIMIGGEAFPKGLLDRLKLLTDAKIYNMYGPTETTIWSTVQELTDSDEIKIGKPIANTQVYILNEDLELVPENVYGELYIAGDGLSRGYLEREELTRERFIKNPFKTDSMMYKTGDIVRWSDGGNIEFIGRADHQVKIRGFRIEPGEIENKLLTHGAINEAVVIDREDKNEIKYLCAYIVTEIDLSIAELRSHLSQELPGYMIPAYFVNLDKIPLTPNGKTNRKALPEPEGKINSGTEYLEPEGETEERLVKIWSDILGIENIGVNDKFFEIGGDSLKIVHLLDEIKDEFECEIKIVDLFRHNTIRQLGELLGPEEEEKEEEQPMIITFPEK